MLMFFPGVPCHYHSLSTVVVNCQCLGRSNWEQWLFIPIINHSLVVPLVCESPSTAKKRHNGAEQLPVLVRRDRARALALPISQSTETISLCNGVLIALIKWDLASLVSFFRQVAGRSFCLTVSHALSCQWGFDEFIMCPFGVLRIVWTYILCRFVSHLSPAFEKNKEEPNLRPATYVL